MAVAYVCEHHCSSWGMTGRPHTVLSPTTDGEPSDSLSLTLLISRDFWRCNRNRVFPENIAPFICIQYRHCSILPWELLNRFSRVSLQLWHGSSQREHGGVYTVHSVCFSRCCCCCCVYIMRQHKLTCHDRGGVELNRCVISSQNTNSDVIMTDKVRCVLYYV